jgi:glucose 1-dehydrogenase
MARGSGEAIVTVSSAHEDWPMPGNIAYCVSKGGAKMLTRTAGVELGPLGIRFVYPAEVADVIVFLASDKARYVNATTVNLDVGLSQSGVGL